MYIQGSFCLTRKALQDVNSISYDFLSCKVIVTQCNNKSNVTCKTRQKINSSYILYNLTDFGIDSRNMPVRTF
jgi:hypothetical protein